MNQIILIILGALITTGLGIIGFFVRGVIRRVDDLEKKIDTFYVELLKNYITKADIKEMNNVNSEAHKELRTEIRKIEHDLIELKTGESR